jgi:hypothetical protein
MNELEVFGFYSAFTFYGRVDVVPCFEQCGYQGIELVGAVLDVNGAWPLSTPELRSQVASGFFDTPAQNCFAMLSSKFSLTLRVGEMSISEGLEECAYDGDSGGMHDVIEVDIVLESDLL